MNKTKADKQVSVTRAVLEPDIIVIQALERPAKARTKGFTLFLDKSILNKRSTKIRLRRPSELGFAVKPVAL